LVAPLILLQLLPFASQRIQRYLKVSGLFRHEPFPAVNVLPTIGDPSIVGGDAVSGAAANPEPTKVSARTADAPILSKKCFIRLPLLVSRIDKHRAMMFASGAIRKRCEEAFRVRIS
jgi:hypothetical protein